ncbi:MAG TPA: polyribonucleotide nucleotidyltransferase, partial [Candidatus Parcubacteria bacterium]|nr:polyribonucleotide nucleotidyltransferase [Candidatus Parcubacteria bacterium]
MTYNLEVSGKKITFDFKNLAEQANGSVFVKLGETMVLATAVCSKQERDVDFFPLTVEFEEKYYAAGKILGSRYLRRESRPSEEAILTARLIDRAIRPRFPKNFFQEVQVITTCLSWDGENDPDIVGLLASSLALLISDIPWQGPIGAVRVGRINGQFILNPSYEEREKSEIDLVFAGIEEGKDILINMIEAETREAAEETVLEAWDFAKPEIKKIIDFQKEIAKKQGKEKMAFVEKTAEPELKNEVKQFLKNKLEKALYGKERKKE